MTPFDQIGGLLGMDPEQLKSLMAQFAPSDDDRKAAKMTGLTQLGLGLLGARKGRELDQAGYAGQNALAARDASLQGSQAAKAQQFAMMEHFAKLNAGQQEAKRKQALNQQIGSLFNPGNPTQGMESRAPTVENAANAPAPRQKWEIYLEASQMAAQGQDWAAAKHWGELAEKHKPKYSQSPQIGMDENGKPYQFVLDDSGNEKRLNAGATPKFREVNRGGQVDIVNDYNLPTTGQSFATTMNPYQSASLGLEREKFGYQKQKDSREGAGTIKPQWDATTGQFVYPPSADNPTGRAVQPQGYAPKAEKPSDEQLKTGGFLDRMQEANKFIEPLEKAGYEPGFGQTVVNGAKGIPLVGGVLGYTAESAQKAAAPDSASYNNAKKAWIRAKLRKESGAVIGAEEEADEDRTYFPQPNDPPAIIKQKAQLRKGVEASLARQARGGYQGGGQQPDPLGLR